MTWRVRLDDVDFSDDDMTLEEMGAYEQVCGESWLIANPVQSVKHAKAFLTVALMRAGLDDEAITERLKGLTRKDLRGVFEFEPDEDTMRLLGDQGADAAPLARMFPGSSAGSSSGASAGSGGRRKKRAASA